MKKVILPVYFNTEETRTSPDLGLPESMNDFELREMIFYRIDCIAKGTLVDTPATMIFVGSELFYCSKTVEEVDEEIQQEWGESQNQEI